MIITTVLLLSELTFNNDATSKKWLLIEPGADETKFSAAIDSLKKQGFVTKQFAQGFPDAGEQRSDSSVNYWSLAEQIAKRHIGTTVIISKNRLDGFKGKRIPLPQDVTWLSSDADSSTFNLAINSHKTDSVVVRRATSNAYLTSFSNENRESSNDQNRNVIAAGNVSVIVASDNKYKYDKDVILAALRAIDKNSVISLDIKSVSPGEYNAADSSDWLVWLTDEKAPINKGNIIVIDTMTQAENMPLLMKGKCIERSCWKISKRLNIQTAVRDKLVMELSSVLFEDAKKSIQAQSVGNDQRALPEQWVWSATSTSEAKPTVDKANQSETAVPLVILMMLLITSERWLALKRNQ